MFKDFQVKTISKDVSKFIKKRLWYLYFPVNFANFKNTFLYRTPLVPASDNKILTTVSMKQQIKSALQIALLEM